MPGTQVVQQAPGTPRPALTSSAGLPRLPPRQAQAGEKISTIGNRASTGGRSVRFAPDESLRQILPCDMDDESRCARTPLHQSRTTRLLQVFDIETDDAQIPGLLQLRPLWRAALHAHTLAPLLCPQTVDSLRWLLRLNKTDGTAFPLPPDSSLRLLVQQGIVKGLITGPDDPPPITDRASLPVLRIDET